MPRRKPASDEHIPNPAARSVPVDTDTLAEPAGSTWAYALGTAREPTALAALQTLMLRDDGWLRVVPQKEGLLVFAKWKFTSRKWPNHYVMYRCDDMNYTDMLWGLVRKLEAVDAEIIKPTYDHPYSDK